MVVVVFLGVELVLDQSIIINNGFEVVFLDLYKVEGNFEINIIMNLLEGLVSNDVNGYIIFVVVSYWDNDGYKVWIFYLCDDVVWSDGIFVIVQDFVYSWQCLVNFKIGFLYVSYLQYV